jgi:hypothetical protein
MRTTQSYFYIKSNEPRLLLFNKTLINNTINLTKDKLIWNLL